MEVASNNGVETMNNVSEGNPEISKGESFLISPEISKVANEICAMSEHSEVDDTAFKAEKIPEDEEKMAIDKKFQLEEEAGTGENEVTEDRMEKGDTDHGIAELNLVSGGEKRVKEVEVIAEQDSSLEEKRGSIEKETSRPQESENEGTKTDENADIESNKQEANIELKKQASIDTPDPIFDSLKKANETVTEDVEKKIIDDEDTNKVQTTLLTETMEEKSKEENSAAMMSIKEVCKESETVPSGTGKEITDMDEHPIADISNSSISDEIVKESIKEDENNPMKSTEEATDSNIVETAKPNDDSSLFDIVKESKEEITPIEVKEDLARSSSFELGESKNDTEEETSVKGSINTADLDSASPAAETEETNIKKAEAEEEKKEINNVLAVEENGLATTEHEGIGVDSADIDVKPVDSSITCEKDNEIPQEEDGMQDKVPNAGREDQMEMTTKEITLKEILGDEMKEHSTMPSEEYEPTLNEERKITDESSEKDQAPYENSEIPVSQATDEILMQKEDNPTVDVPKAESEDTGTESGHEVKENLAEESNVHTEQESGECSSVSEVTNVSNGEEPREIENPTEACKAKTLQGEQSSDLGFETEKIEDGKPLGETVSTCKDGEKAVQEEENLAKNLAKPESLKEDTEIGKEETELSRGAHDQIPEVVNVNDEAKNVELALAGFEEKPKSDSEPMAEVQSNETFPESSKSQADETSTDVQNQASEKQIKEELEDKLEDEDYINREQNANEVTEAVILSEEKVDKEVEKADDSEDTKEHTMEEESSTNELHPVSKGDETINEVEGYSSVSPECLKEADSKEQIEAKKSEVDEHSTKDREASLVVGESEEMRQDEESVDPVSMRGERRESEEKIKEDIVDESKLCQDESDIEAVTKLREETSLNDTEVNEELVNTSSISSVNMSLETTESDANQETKEVKLEEISSDLSPKVSTNDNDEVEKQSLNVEILDKDEAEVIKRDPDAVYISKDQIDEAEKSLTSNADELRKIESPADGDHIFEDKGTEQDAETKQSLTAEELEANEVEETKGVPETSSEYITQRVETIVEDDISSHKSLPEEKPEEQLQTSASTLPSGDEEIRTAPPIEKIEEEMQKDAVIKYESLEDSSDTKTTEEVCLQKEEQRLPKAVSEEETIVDQGLQKEEPEEQIQTTSSALPSEEREHGTGAISEEKEYVKTKEEATTKLDVVTGDEITGEQTLSENKPEEGTTKQKIMEAEIPDKISEDSSDAYKTVEICLEREEIQELEGAKKYETAAAAQALQVEESNEQSLTSPSVLPSENLENGTTTNVNEVEEENAKEVEIQEKERPQEPDAIMDQEITVAQASITEKALEIETISTVEKLHEEKRKEAENLENEKCEDSSARETEEICLQKEKPNKLHALPKEEITSGQTFSEGQSDEHLHISSSAIASEELEHETKKTEDEKTNKEETIKDEIREDASDAMTTEETCSQKQRSMELEAVVEDEMTAGHTLTEKKSEEQVQNPTSALPSKEEECGSTSTVEKIESEKIEEAEFLQDDNVEDVSLQKERLQEDEALAKDENACSQTLRMEKSEEQIPNPVVTLPSDEHKYETVNEVDKTEEEKVKEEEIQNEDSDGAKTVEEICSEKDDTREPQAVLEGETIASHVIAEESQGHGTLREEKKIKEAETLEDEISPQSECPRELQGAIEDGANAAQTLPGEKPADHLHVTTSILPSEVQEDETKETELQEDESREKIPEQTREIEEASNVKMETCEKAFDNELLSETEDAAIKEKLVKARDETGGEENQCEKTNEGNAIILKEVSKEEVMEDKEVTETSYSTPHSEELTKGGSGEDELKDKQIEDNANEALETTCKTEELVVEAQKTSENEIIEKQIVFEDKTVEDPGQVSVAGIETTTVTEEESSTELSQAEGTKDFAEGNEIINGIQQPEETTNIASDKQIPREFDPIENTNILTQIGKEHVLTKLQERVTESSLKAEVVDVKEIYSKVVEHAGEKTTDNSGEEITKESTSMEDSTKVSSSDHVESSTKETLQVTQDMIEEREAKDETGAAQILLVEKPEEQSPAPSSILPSEEEHGVTTKVDAVEEKELQEVETLDKDSSDTKTGEEICLEKEENKELKAVVEQETIAIQAPPSEIKEDPVSHFEDGCKEDELKDEHTGDKTNETMKAPTYEIQKEVIPGEADPIESRTRSSIGKEHFPTEQQDRALETSERPEVGDLEPGKAQEICSEAGVDHGEEKRADNSGVEITQEPASTDSGKLSLSDLLQKPTREKMQVAERVIEERELTVSKEEPDVEEAETIQVKEAKTDEEKDGEEGDEHNKTDSGSDAPVMVEAPRDTDTKPHKKSHNILSGVGSKVKHSISKVKKAITGKSSHSKEPKPISPKESEK
ncbi:hypothetical protein CRYUN_Cryun17cG0017900 [Craigia yunnanensis]